MRTICKQAALFLLVALLAAEATVEKAMSQSMTVEQILSKIDEKGTTLRSMSSSISQRKWTQILEEFDEGERGQFHFLRDKDKVYLRRDIPEPQENTLVIRDGKVFFYQPKIKQVQEYNLGQKRDRAEFLLLGFGSTKEALKKTYDIRLIKKEAIDGKETYQLELKPKSKEVSAYFSKIELWVDTQLWVPIQQKLVEHTEDFLLIRFEDIVLNPNISESKFDLKLPKDVRVVGL